MTTAQQVADAAVAHKAADDAEAARKSTAGADRAHTAAGRKADADKDHPLSPEQQKVQTETARKQKDSDERAAATAKAKQDFQDEVQAAVDKRNKALEKYHTPDLNGIVCEAYEATKGIDDPPFAEAILPHRDNLRTWADSVIRTGLVGDNPSDFEKKVAELLTKKEYEDLGRQNTGAWGASEARDDAEDYEGGENEKAVVQKNTKADSKVGQTADAGKAHPKK